MSHRIDIPVSVPESSVIVPNEVYTIAYHNLRASVSIDNWQYCTEFTAPIDTVRLEESIVVSDEWPRSHVLIGNALIEPNNHDIGEINFHYRRVLTEILPFVDRSASVVIGVRQCADIHTSCLLNTRIDTQKLLKLYPYLKKLPSGVVSMDIGLVMENEELLDCMSLFKFSADEYQKLCETETLHRDYNGLIDSVIRNDEDQNDLSSVSRAKVCVIPTGQMIMTGSLNRRAIIYAYHIVLQVVASCAVM